MKTIRVTGEDEQGNQIFNEKINVAEISDLERILDTLQAVASATEELARRLLVLEGKNRRLR